MTLAESETSSQKKLLNRILLKSKSDSKANRIAISGSPGVGKSTILNKLVSDLSEDSSKKIAIIAIDPTSEKSQGSILGDKTRMDDLINKKNVYIRPFASRKETGGIALATRNAVLLLELMGFDQIFIETVGVGQSAFEVSKISDLFLLVVAPGGGDELQGIKRGIIEMADILIINKADGKMLDAANETFREYKNAMKFDNSKSKCSNRIIKVSAETNVGLDEIKSEIHHFFSDSLIEKSIIQNRILQEKYWFEKGLKNLLYNHFIINNNLPELKSIKNKLAENQISSLEALNQIEQSLS